MRRRVAARTRPVAVQGVGSLESSMLTKPRYFITPAIFARFLSCTANRYRVVYILLAGTLLLAWQVRAKEQIDQVNDLMRQLQSQDATTRGSAVEALKKIGPDAKDAVPALIAALKDQDFFVRISAIEALEKIGEAAIPALIAAFKDQEAFVRIAVVATLGEIRPKSKDVIPVLLAALKDRNEGVRRAAVEAMGSFGTDEVPILIAALKGQDTNCSGPQKLDSDFETVYSPERGRYPCKNIAHLNLSSRPA